MFDHVGLEVADLARSAAFYDALMLRIGGRRMHESPSAIAYGRTRASLWIVQRGLAGTPGHGHIALTAAGKAAVDAAYAAGLAAGGSDDGPPGPRPQYGQGYYAAYLRDPDGLRVEIVSGAH
jgi:catechol 2,3-dioxygenase-like lactoylglutathione lyase family enzyme